MRLLVSSLPAPPFVVSTVYVAGEFASPIVSNGYTYLVVTGGTAAVSEPTWPIVLGGRVTSGSVVFMAVGSTRLLDTTDYNAELRVRTEPGGTVYLLCTATNDRIELGYDPPKWVLSTAYVAGQQVVPRTLNGWVYQCVTAGTTNSSQPTWPTTLGANVTDGSVVWRCETTDAGVTNLRLSLVPADTTALTDWGYGRYDLELYDDFNSIKRIIEGNVVLSNDIT
jgi:hypothetical protein